MKRESKCIILGICCVGVLLEEFYFFQVYQNQVPVIAIGMGVLLILSYLLFSNLFSLREEWNLERKQTQEEQLKKQTALLEQLLSNTSNATTDTSKQELDSVETLEKAIYVAVQKNTKTMQECLEQLDQHLAGDFENVVSQIQQTGERNAKISVKYGRENTKSLMVFQQKAYDNVVLGMEELANEFSASLQKTQEKLDIIINAMADGSISIPTTDSPSVTTVPEETTSKEETQETITTSEPVQEEVSETYIDTDNTSAEEVPAPDTIPEVSAAIEEPTPMEEETPSGSDDPNHVMTPEEIAALVAGNNEPSPVEESPSVSDDPNHVMTPEEIAALVAGNNDPSPMEEAPSVSDDLNHVMTPEEIAALVAGNNEPSPVEDTPSVSDDPNHVMTPEEIAALVAGNNEPSPAEVPTPSVSDDPNHVMTPEEIAALIAGNN